MAIISDLKIREYGSDGPFVTVLHGGPGAPGYMAPVASRLGRNFRVIEPFQRHSGNEPLTVKRHVQDLREIIEQLPEQKAVIVGHSWGAMLALAFAADYPDSVSCLALIGCGTFDENSRRIMQHVRDERMQGEILERFNRLETDFPDPDLRLGEYGRIFKEIDSYDLISANSITFSCDSLGHEQTLEDVIRLQEEEIYPQKFVNIKCPAIMFHGKYDPHPGKIIKANLEEYVSNLEYVEWDECGHYPWLEKSSREDFYHTLTDWVLFKIGGTKYFDSNSRL